MHLQPCVMHVGCRYRLLHVQSLRGTSSVTGNQQQTAACKEASVRTCTAESEQDASMTVRHDGAVWGLMGGGRGQGRLWAGCCLLCEDLQTEL